jgi:WD40 repeat protein
MAQLWDPRTGAQMAVLEGHEEPVQACAFSADGTLLATVGNGYRGLDRTVRLWDVRSGEPIAVIPIEASGRCLAFHPWAPLIAAAGDAGRVAIFNLIPMRLGPIVVTAGNLGAGPHYRCPRCQLEHSLWIGDLGHDLTCPTLGCGLGLRLNAFVVERLDHMGPF